MPRNSNSNNIKKKSTNKTSRQNGQDAVRQAIAYELENTPKAPQKKAVQCRKLIQRSIQGQSFICFEDAVAQAA